MSPGLAPAPVSVGVVSLVVLSPKVPLSLARARLAKGADGGVASTMAVAVTERTTLAVAGLLSAS